MQKVKGIKPPVSYYGGKQIMSKEILPLIPKEAKLYCEPFFGGGAILFGKEKHDVEVINDLNGEVINFYWTIQRHFDELKDEIDRTLHSRSMHDDAAIVYNHPHLFTPVKRAWAFWVQCNQGFGSAIDKGWAYARVSNSAEKKTSNAKQRFTEVYKDRLERVQIECRDAVQVIKSRDFEGSFFYCDPPYVNSNCGHYGGYGWDDYRRLLDTLAEVKGKFLLSSYPSVLLDEYVKVHGWQQREFEKGVAVTHLTSKRKVEVLTANYGI